MTISITLNGEEKELEREMTVRELLDHLEVRSPAVAVEVNLKIIRKQDHESCTITHGARVEIVTFVGGG
jgi:sulfur carrier protein